MVTVLGRPVHCHKFASIAFVNGRGWTGSSELYYECVVCQEVDTADRWRPPPSAILTRLLADSKAHWLERLREEGDAPQTMAEYRLRVAALEEQNQRLRDASVHQRRMV